VGVTGSASISGGTFTVRGSGADVFGNHDAFRFHYQTLSGDGEIIARVAGVGNTDPFAKAGVMVRSGLGADARNVFLSVTRSNGLRLTARAASGGATDSTPSSGAAPQWLRLVRRGTQFTAYKSTDGSRWTSVGSRTVGMTGNLLVGLAVSSHNNRLLNTSTFDNVRVIRSASAPRVVAATTTPPEQATAPTNLGVGGRSRGVVPWI
jgi:regulation of enolase protein 1 (concanavalin A-like superfamily)